jgi:Ca-activated chloride channel family protein
MTMISFKDPWILWLIPLCLLGMFYLIRRQRPASFRFSSTNIVTGLKDSWRVRALKGLPLLRLFVLGLFLVALAGPRQILQQTEVKTEGIDILLAIDASGSMAAQDFVIKGKRKDRLTVVKDVVIDFISQRQGDRIGIVVFAAQAYTISPLTTDYDWLETNLERVELGLIREDGTAIGSALATALSRLKESEAKSKIVILLTDGKNNAGEFQPLDAAKAAQALGIKVYTIGAGSKGLVPFPVQDLFGRKVMRNVRIDMDEGLLREMAAIADGQYFRATDTESLKEIYEQIDKLEKTEREEIGYKEYKQLFPYVLLSAMLLLTLEVVLTGTVLMTLP